MIRNKNKIAALIVGAGAVKNAWAPVLRALQQYHDFPLTSDGANSFLSRVVYLLRWYSSTDSEIAKRELCKHVEFLDDIRNSIAKEMKESQNKNEITVQEGFEKVIYKFLVPYSNTVMFVTTNWETVCGEALYHCLNKTHKVTINPLHIHGNIDNPKTLYLPSEMTKEPYRTTEEEKSIGGMHGSIWRGLEGAHRVLVYGLSIDPLDAELGQTLAAGWSNCNLEEIIIINPNHGEVAHRVNLLLDRKRDVKIFGYSPDILEVKHDYTIKRYKANK